MRHDRPIAVSVRLPPEMLGALDERSRGRWISRAEAVRILLDGLAARS